MLICAYIDIKIYVIDPDAAIILSVIQKLLDKRAKNPENFLLIILEVCINVYDVTVHALAASVQCIIRLLILCFMDAESPFVLSRFVNHVIQVLPAKRANKLYTNKTS